MEFESKSIPKTKDYVADFINDLDDEIAYKILDKLSSWESLSLLQLTRAEHIKKVESDIWEVRVRVKTDCYRFLGYIHGSIFLMVHAIVKKSQKIKRKDINIAKERVKRIKMYENN